MKAVEGKVFVVAGRTVSDRETAATILDTIGATRSKVGVLPRLFNQLGWGI